MWWSNQRICGLAAINWRLGNCTDKMRKTQTERIEGNFAFSNALNFFELVPLVHGVCQYTAQR